MIRETVRIKFLAKVGYGLGQPPRLSDDGIAILRATNIERGKLTPRGLIFAEKVDLPLKRVPLLRTGEILVVRSGAYTGDSARVTDRWAGSAPGYDLRITPQDVDSAYLAYCLLSTGVLDQITLASARAAQPHLNAEDLGDIPISLPPLDEQRRIANFLDAETAQLDDVIALRNRQLSLLSEMTVSRSFSTIRGERIPGPRKPSNLPWLGDVPRDWRIAAVSHLFEVELGKMLNAERAAGDHLKPYLRVANVQWNDIDVSDLAHMDFPPGDRARYRVRTGDLLVNEGGSWPGRAAIWNGQIPEIYYQKALHRIRPLYEDSTRWLMYCLRVAENLGVFFAQGNATTMTHLTREQLRPQRFPFPSEELQGKLAAELDGVYREEREMAALLRKQFSLLAERRQALITAAVTGQFDATTARPVLP